MDKFIKLFCSIFLLLSVQAAGQTVYQDVFLLKRALTIDHDVSITNDSAVGTLFNYISDSLKNIYKDSSGNIIRDSIRKYYSRENKFIKISGGRRQLQSSLLQFSSSGFSKSATTIADGIGKFLAKRTKQELNVLFFDRFREFLNTHPEIGQLFPSTSILLNTILNQEYPNLLSTLRAAFDSDLKGLLKNIAAIADIDISACEKCATNKKIEKCKTRLKTIQTFFTSDKGKAFVAGLLIANGVIDQQNPAEILSSVAGNNRIRGINSDLINSIELLNVFSESLRSENASEIWVSGDEIKGLLNEPATLNIYLGLIYEQIKNKEITIGGSPVAQTYITPRNIVGLKNYLNSIATAVQNLETAYRKFQTAMNDSSKSIVLQAGRYVRDVQAFFVLAMSLKTIDNSIPATGNQGKQIFLYVDSSLSLVQKLIAKEYYGAVLSATILLENILKTRNDFNADGQLISSNSKVQDTALAKKQFLRSFLRYANFASNVVAAENSDAVEKAISAIALPPGSASIKRNTNFNISFQAYTGFVGGNIKNEKGTFNSVSVYAPVGIAFSVGLRPWWKPRFFGRQNPENKRGWGSLTVFGSIVDMGAFVSYRFYKPDEKLSDSVNIAWSNIFAPGVNLVYGIPRWPISVGFGGQYQATLRKVDAASASTVKRSGLRYNFFLALDLPVLNLFTSKK